MGLNDERFFNCEIKWSITDMSAIKIPIIHARFLIRLKIELTVRALKPQCQSPVH